MIEVEIKNLNVVKERFKDMEKKANDPKYAMDVIGAKAFKDVVNSFNVEQNEDGKKWAKFKDPKTGKRVNQRPTKRGGSKLLQDTGILRGSIRWAASRLEAKVFTKVKYAKYHDSGEGKMKRQFMWVNDKLRLQFASDLLKFIKG